jgi:hypothetical protein
LRPAFNCCVPLMRSQTMNVSAMHES